MLPLPLLAALGGSWWPWMLWQLWTGHPNPHIASNIGVPNHLSKIHWEHQCSTWIGGNPKDQHQKIHQHPVDGQQKLSVWAMCDGLPSGGGCLKNQKVAQGKQLPSQDQQGGQPKQPAHYPVYRGHPPLLELWQDMDHPLPWLWPWALHQGPWPHQVWHGSLGGGHASWGQQGQPPHQDSPCWCSFASQCVLPELFQVQTVPT